MKAELRPAFLSEEYETLYVPVQNGPSPSEGRNVEGVCLMVSVGGRGLTCMPGGML